jgi:hypothetical protein
MGKDTVFFNYSKVSGYKFCSTGGRVRGALLHIIAGKRRLLTINSSCHEYFQIKIDCDYKNRLFRKAELRRDSLRRTAP